MKTIINNIVFKKVKTLFFIFFIFMVSSAYTHPHVFIESAFTFVFNDTGLDGLRVHWEFDEVFSASIIMEFDVNSNNVLEKSEIKAIEQNAFSNLKNFDYFMYLSVNNTKRKVSSVKNFSAQIHDRKLQYFFYIPLSVSAGSSEVCIVAGSYDDTYFCAVDNSSIQPVRYENAEAFDCSFKMNEDKRNAYWGGSIIPETVELHFRIKK